MRIRNAERGRTFAGVDTFGTPLDALRGVEGASYNKFKIKILNQNIIHLHPEGTFAEEERLEAKNAEDIDDLTPYTP